MNTLFLLFVAFSRANILGYGGGPSIIPLVRAEVVRHYEWMTMAEFTDALAMGYALPGPIATKMAAVVGYHVSGVPGAIAALIGTILPTAVLVLILFLFFSIYQDNPVVVSILRGIRPVVLALLIWVVIDMAPTSVVSVSTGIIVVVTSLVFAFTSFHPAYAILLGGIIGYFLL